MIDIQLENIDPEEIEDVLRKVESSFAIKFIGKELIHITTFGELCDHITNKIELDNSNDCTSQQAFYKLRNAISSTLQLNSKTISLDTPLEDILPEKSKRVKVNKMENQLRFKLNILQPSNWIINFLTLILLTSLIVLFIKWQIGLTGILFSVTGLWWTNKTGNKLNLKTVRQVVEKMTRENYLKSRRNAKTFNKGEIETILIDLFSNDLDIDKSKLTREAKFV